MVNGISGGGGGGANENLIAEASTRGDTYVRALFKYYYV